MPSLLFLCNLDLAFAQVVFIHIISGTFTMWYNVLILNFGPSLYILRTWKQSRFGLFRIGCHPNDADQLSLLFNHSKASLSFKVPFYQICCMAFDFYHIAATLLRKCLTLEISVNQGMPVCAVNTAHGGENATDINKDEARGECQKKAPFCKKFLEKRNLNPVFEGTIRVG